jgi:bis(5'-nucleosyl)-tetraphosphatase (symmetrical)
MQRVFVGDVQGCADELEELLDRVEARVGPEFELWLVGDLVNRGPANVRALERVRPLADAGRCLYVLGNHEIGLLRVFFGLEAPGPRDTIRDVLARADAAAWVAWIRRLPLLARGVLGATPFAMVHAAVHPDWTLDAAEERARAVEAVLGGADEDAARALLAGDADPALVDALGLLTCARSVTPCGRWSAGYPGSRDERGVERVAWHAAWSQRGHRYGVVYGHWALQGLHVAPFLRGLDTGCVHHGRDHDGYLTAWLPDPGDPEPFAVPDARFLQVRAHRRYVLDETSAPTARSIA